MALTIITENFKLLIIFFLFLKDKKLTIRELLKRLEITC